MVDQNEPASGGTKELDLLIMEAGGMEADRAATAPEAVAEASAQAEAMSLIQSNGQAIYHALELAVPLIAPLYPCIATIYDEAARQRIAGVLGPLTAKYGWSVGEMGGAYKEEIAAAFVCVPLAVATVTGIKAEIAARSGAKVAEAVRLDKSPPLPGAKPGDVNYREAAPEGLG